MAKIIAIEGGDKVGKETQSKLLVAALRVRGYRAIRVEPAKETSATMRKLIYRMLETGAAKRLPNTFQFVQFCNKVVFQTLLLPAMEQVNDFIVVDRWALSGYVYGKAENINPSLNQFMLNRLRRPDLTLVLSGDSYKREGAADSYEKDSALQEEVKQLYWDIGKNWPEHELVNNQGTQDEVTERLLLVLSVWGYVSEVSPRWS